MCGSEEEYGHEAYVYTAEGAEGGDGEETGGRMAAMTEWHLD